MWNTHSIFFPRLFFPTYKKKSIFFNHTEFLPRTNTACRSMSKPSRFCWQHLRCRRPPPPPPPLPSVGIPLFVLVCAISNTARSRGASRTRPRPARWILFWGKSHYTNCKGYDTEVVIACDTTETLCSYSEQPYPATSPAGCGVSGSFDPATHLTRDPVTGMCRLNFISLASSCLGAPVAGIEFGVMVEVPQNTGQDKNPNDNSGLLLRFSRDGGMTYYNSKKPRNTVPLNESSPRRNLEDICTTKYECSIDVCAPVCPTETFGGISDGIDYEEHHQDFETCFRFAETQQYCWTKSWYDSKKDQFKRCHPNGEEWDIVDHACNYEIKYPYGLGTYCHADPPYVCGDPCQEIHCRKWGGTMGVPSEC